MTRHYSWLRLVDVVLVVDKHAAMLDMRPHTGPTRVCLTFAYAGCLKLTGPDGQLHSTILGRGVRHHADIEHVMVVVEPACWFGSFV
jgi:hypothetical protein